MLWSLNSRHCSDIPASDNIHVGLDLPLPPHVTVTTAAADIDLRIPRADAPTHTDADELGLYEPPAHAVDPAGMAVTGNSVGPADVGITVSSRMEGVVGTMSLAAQNV